MAESRCVVLPEECWELIFKQLDDDLEAVSLVCREFLSISNNLRGTLINVHSPTIEDFTRLLKRFRNVKVIDLGQNFDGGDIDRVVLEIARSGLNLEALYVSYENACLAWNLGPRLKSLKELGSNMRNLKTLQCSHCYDLAESDLPRLAAVAASMPRLEELDISHAESMRDEAIEVLASNLRNLRKINLSMSGELTDRSLYSLSLNCEFLREIEAYGCSITQNCIAYLFRRSPNLVSLSVRTVKMNFSMSSSPLSSSFTIANSIAYAKALRALKISSTYISDSLLNSIAEARLPLEKLSLKFCRNFTISGLSILLQACHCSLKELHLGGVKFLTDEYIRDLSHYLHNLAYINLKCCHMLTKSTLFILISKCPLLEVIVMQNTGIGDREEDFDIDIGLGKINHRIQSLYLSDNNNLNDKLLKKIGFSCPNLQVLDVSCCPRITCKGIEEILKSCKEIKHLIIGSSGDAKFFGTYSEPFKVKLEVLEAKNLRIDDTEMAMIAKRCTKLRHLTLYSSKVTAEGLNEVLDKCTKLKYITLKSCNTVPKTWVSIFYSRLYLRENSNPMMDQISHGDLTW